MNTKRAEGERAVIAVISLALIAVGVGVVAIGSTWTYRLAGLGIVAGAVVALVAPRSAVGIAGLAVALVTAVGVYVGSS